MDKKILITGATGLIGKRIVNELCRLGAFVKIISTDAEKASHIFSNQFTIQTFSWSNYNNPF
ncbi:MAG: hypothetical protein ABI462_10985, partial [Ignavibacteria bacterium]